MIVRLGRLANLDGAEQAGGVGVSEPRAMGGGGRGSFWREGAGCPEVGGGWGVLGRGGATLCFTLV